MANPNKISISSLYGESIGQALTTDVTIVIMTVAEHALVKINYIAVTNTHATAAIDVSVAITKAGFTSAGVASGDDNAGIFFLAKTINCPADDVLVVLDKPIYLMEFANLEAGARAATGDIFVSYEVINDA